MKKYKCAGQLSYDQLANNTSGKIKKSTMNQVIFSLCLFAGAHVAQGEELIGEYTFNDRSKPVTQEKLLAPTNVVAGAQVSSLGFSSTYAPDFFGVSAIPADSNNDAYSFAILRGDLYVMLLDKSHDSSQGQSAFNKTADTGVAVQPLHFTVSADTGFDVTVTGITFSTQGVSGDWLEGSFQEAGIPWQEKTPLSKQGPTETELTLSSPVVIAAGASKDFTIYLRHNDGGRIRLDNIAINGSVSKQ